MADATRELEQACLELALAIKTVDQPTTSAEVRGLAKQYTKIARWHLEDHLGREEGLLTRAARYLTQVHAIPPMGDDTRWFSNMLQAVLEIARPNSGLDGEALKFLDDLSEGIASFRDET